MAGVMRSTQFEVQLSVFVRSPVLFLALLVTFAAGCASRSRPPFHLLREINFRRDADSVALERTRCFGECPIYRVLLSRSGRVRFNPGRPFLVWHPDSVLPIPPTQKDSVSPREFFEIAAFADMIGFAALPSEIQANPHMCGSKWTDSPTAIVTFYLRDRVIQVTDYHGCPWGPWALRRLENAIDDAAGVARWTRAASDSTRRPHN